jgi:hypothetical protein
MRPGSSRHRKLKSFVPDRNIYFTLRKPYSTGAQRPAAETGMSRGDAARSREKNTLDSKPERQV